MSLLEIARIDLVIANRVIARYGAVDAYGHVSVRHPDDPGLFLLSRSRSPQLVDRADIMTFDLDGKAQGADNRPTYSERYIHAELYRARPDVNAIVHGHPLSLIPFSVGDIPVRPIFFTADEFGGEAPVWDIRTAIGDGTNLLIENPSRARPLAAAFGADKRVVLLRGHGFVACGRSAAQLIRVCKALLENARVQLDCLRMATVVEMSPAELAARRETVASRDDEGSSMMRAYEYEAAQVGLTDLLAERAALRAALTKP